MSVEFDAQSPDRPVAEQRLRVFPNVELLYGDARKLLPSRLEPGDVVLIDGPKHFRAIRFALRLLRSRKPSLVFIHDLPRGCPERRLLERQVPETVYSDDMEFVRRFKGLDDECWRKDHSVGDGEWKPFGFGGPGGEKSYGPTLACIPGHVQRRWPALFVSTMVAQLKAKGPGGRR